MSDIQTKPDFHGIQVYEILDNGNLLNAVYTNTGLSIKDNTNKVVGYHIDNEIARKIIHDNKGVDGDYQCRYIETGDTLVISRNLKITNLYGVYEFEWSTNNGLSWKGIGLMSGTTHIAVSYIHS